MAHPGDHIRIDIEREGNLFFINIDPEEMIDEKLLEIVANIYNVIEAALTVRGRDNQHH